jgi:hypothetical protein
MIDPRTTISVAMPAERWQQVLALLSEALAPHRLTDPLIREIHAQCMAADHAGPQLVPDEAAV